MNFGKSYLTCEIINAADLETESSEKLRIVCPECLSPLTYIADSKNRRYFRHPKRTAQQIQSELGECEERVNNLKAYSVGRYNKIIEQTTLHQFQLHFAFILGKVGGLDRDAVCHSMELANMPKTRKLFDYLENCEKEALVERRRYVRNLRDAGDLYTAQKTEELVNRQTKSELHVSDKIEMYKLHRGDIDPITEKEMNEKITCISKMLCNKNSAEMRRFVYFLSSTYDLGNDSHFDGFDEIDWELSTKPAKQIQNESLESYIKCVHLNYRKLTKRIGLYANSHCNGLSSKEQEELFEDIKTIFNSSNMLKIMWKLELINSVLLEYEPAKWVKSATDLAQEDFDNAIESDNAKPGYIYICFNNLSKRHGPVREIKIGKTQNIPKRSATYDTYSPEGYTFHQVWSVLDRHKAEKLVKRKLAKFNIKNEHGGTEWYQLDLHEATDKVQSIIETFNQNNGYFARDLDGVVFNQI